MIVTLTTESNPCLYNVLLAETMAGVADYL